MTSNPNPAFNDSLHVFLSPTLISVVRDAIDFFINTPCHRLPPANRFIGPGVYGLYYSGAFAPYTLLAAQNQTSCEQPIYIGKAVPPGSRAARNNVSVATELHNRLNEHAGSILSAKTTLDLADFQCRFMILRAPESDLIGTVDAGLIRHFRPLWNAGIDGFGNHDPGSGRYNQSPSEWDTLHPGRTWAKRLTGTPPTSARILQRVVAHLSATS